MEINEVTIFKLILFTVCIVLITIFVVKISAFSDVSDNKNMCSTLIVQKEVQNSIISAVCPDGYYVNFGKFTDVDGDYKCCVQYGDMNG